MKKILILLLLAISLSNNTNAQGCVAIRSSGGMCTMDHAEMLAATESNHPAQWLFNANTRYFNSYKHFVGKEEQTQRVDNGTNVINHSFTLDAAITRLINKRWSVSADLPIISNTRSSLYEHGGKERHTTSSFGLGDIRVWASYWMLNPAKSSKFNVQLGLGLKFATGDYRYTDRFYTATGTTQVGPVDQSIQLGDGGTGVTTEVNGFWSISRKLNMYGNFYYLINPREVNGTSTARGGTPSASAIANGSDVMSVPDQFMVRGGLNYTINKLTVTGGIRHECIPVHDLIGGSLGFRRPGYITSFEPGLTYAFKKINVYTFVPVALVRNRTQSMADKISTDNSGKYTHGDAAFSDYALNIGFSMSF
jgi:hypothetical protein